MKYVFSLCINVLFCFFFIVNSIYAEKKEHYINGIDAHYPPFSFIDEHGNPTGFDVEALNWIANKLGFTVEHRPIGWDGIIPALLTKKIDMICSGMSISSEREKNILFTRPYWITQKVLIVPKDSKLTPEEIFYGENIIVGVQCGTNESTFLEKEIKNKGYKYKLRHYDSSPLVINDLLNGRINAAVMDSLPIDNAIKHNKAIKKLYIIDYSDAFGVAVRKENTQLAKRIEDGFLLLQADPFWETLKKKYLPLRENP